MGIYFANLSFLVYRFYILWINKCICLKKIRFKLLFFTPNNMLKQVIKLFGVMMVVIANGAHTHIKNGALDPTYEVACFCDTPVSMY